MKPGLALLVKPMLSDLQKPHVLDTDTLYVYADWHWTIGVSPQSNQEVIALAPAIEYQSAEALLAALLESTSDD